MYKLRVLLFILKEVLRMADIINILHLSDLHFGIESIQNNGNITQYAIAHRNVTSESMIKTLIEKIKEGVLLPPDIIVITGDIAWSAKKQEYDEAKIWIEKLLGAFNSVSIQKISTEDIVICPGNHDFNRQNGRTQMKISSITDSVALLSGPDPHLLEPFQEYSNFCKELGVKPYYFGSDEIAHYLFGVTKVKEITFVILNSAWNTKEDICKGDLWLGEPQLLQMVSNNNLIDIHDNPNIIVTLFHHPADWLADSDHYRYYETCQKPAFAHVTQFSHIILNGHTHGVITDPDQIFQRSMVFTGGATYGKQSYWNSFEMLQVDKDQRHVWQSVVLYNPSETQWELKSERKHTLAPYRPKDGTAEEVTEPRLSYYPSRGVLLNPKDKARNVAFRLETFVNILDQLHMNVAKYEQTDSDNIFFQPGYSCGNLFGKQIWSKWESESSPPNLDQSITRWCEFDSSMGFGKLSAHLEIEEGNPISGLLTVKNSFEKNKGPAICAFMRGYFEGCLNAIAQPHFETPFHLCLECDPNQCSHMKETAGVSVCVFNINPQQMPSPNS